MNESEHLEIQLEEIGKKLRRSPLPPKQIRSKWMTEGIEEANDFWNRVAPIWDRLPANNVPDESTVRFKQQFPATEDLIEILDIGCGTGRNFDLIWDRAANAHITGIDNAPAMLAEANSKYGARRERLTLIEGSCLDVQLGHEKYHYVCSTLTVHHFPPDTKLLLYRKILESLRPHGEYIELDQSVTQKWEKRGLQFYGDYVSTLPGAAQGEWNYDVTLSLETQTHLLQDAGYIDVEVCWEDKNEGWNGMALVVAKKP